MGKYLEAHNEMLSKPHSIPMSEIGENPPIEQVAERDFVKTAELEKFMHEDLVIMVHPTGEEGSYDMVPIQVNRINCPIQRGVPVVVKRKYVEILARCRNTKYHQRLTDPGRPDAMVMEEKTVLSYPFAVIEDKNPRGRVWLEAILKER
jgi:hypothetical protein